MPSSDFRYTRGLTGIDRNAGASTDYLPLNGDGDATTEASVQTLIRKAYTAKNLWTYCTAYTGTQTITVALRESGVTSALTDTINATGIFEETTATEALDDGDLVNYILVVADSGHGDALTITTVSCVLSHASADWPVLVRNATGYSSISAGLVGYFAIAGGGIYVAAGNEIQRQRTARAASTLSNLRIYCASESLTIDAPITTRLNGAAGGQSVTPNAVGSFEDTVGTDTIAAGDEINYLLDATLGVAGSVNVLSLQVLSASTARQAICVYGISLGIGSTQYLSLDGSSAVSYIEAVNGVTQRTTNVLKNLFTYVSAYTLNVAATVDLRINASSSAVTTAPNATGVFEDTTNSVTLVATDEANYRLITTAASSGALTVQLISVEETQPSTASFGIPFFMQSPSAIHMLVR